MTRDNEMQDHIYVKGENETQGNNEKELRNYLETSGKKKM